MADNEFGPFQTEREALATRAAARIRAAFDAKPGVGASVPESLAVMTEACGECGVELGRMDLSTLQDIAWRETFETVSLAGMIRRAYAAGKAAALEGAETGWGLYYESDSEDPVIMPYTEEQVRQVLRESGDVSPGVRRTVVTRQVTPWREVPR